jgi:hypothetical protein
MLFSQRIGITPTGKLAQHESMDLDLRNSLWSVLTLYCWNGFRHRDGTSLDYVMGSNLHGSINKLWFYYYKQPVDTIPDFWDRTLQKIRTDFFNYEWYQVYDFIEFVCVNFDTSVSPSLRIPRHMVQGGRMKTGGRQVLIRNRRVRNSTTPALFGDLPWNHVNPSRVRQAAG